MFFSIRSARSMPRLGALLLALSFGALSLPACGAGPGSEAVKSDAIVPLEPPVPNASRAPDPTVQKLEAPTAQPVPVQTAQSVPAKVPAVPAAPTSGNGTKVKAPQPRMLNATIGGSVAESWKPLIERLKEDQVPQSVLNYFEGLPEYSAYPMSVKVKELYNNAFVKKPASNGTVRVTDQTPLKARIYKNTVTPQALEKITAYLEEYKTTFAAMEETYPVPKEVVASLMYVETHLGVNVGKENAFWSLACMAAATEPALVTDNLTDLPLTEEHNPWLQSKLTLKSDWAYKELKALLLHADTNGPDPRTIPGSVYGAIGLCQFMPSNLIPYGADGDGDGKVNLFNPPDAIFSAARYLTEHGWKKDISVDGQRDMLRRYNNLMRYANTILTLAESARTGVLQKAPADITPEMLAGLAPAKKPAAKKAPAKKPAPQKAAGKAKGKNTAAAPKPLALEKY